MRSVATVLPSDGNSIFQQSGRSTSEIVDFDFAPAVFKLPAKRRVGDTVLYVVVSGQWAFSRASFRATKTLHTEQFMTRAAYFRQRANSLEHVLGMHYDFEPNAVGHPAFHAQLRGYPELASAVIAQFRLSADTIVEDCTPRSLPAVRVPTAEMDVFSCCLQLCADHAIHGESSVDERRAFNRLLQGTDMCGGAARLLDRLSTSAADRCYRSRHWYPQIAEASTRAGN